MRILLTGTAGFIGSTVAETLLKEGYDVIGVDNMNDYYDLKLKQWRLQRLKKYDAFKFHETDIEEFNHLEELFKKYKFDVVVNEAARAGVRYSIQDPWVYMSTNATGTLNLLELMRQHGVKKFVLASTSSLYAGQKMPFREDLPVNTPISPYAASKKAAEVLAYTYHYLYGIDVTVLRYFTVYGPAGRPDMSIFRFIYWIKKGMPIELFGDGTQQRDFTYVEDVAKATVKAIKPVGYEIINVGNNQPHKLLDMIKIIEKLLGQEAEIVFKDFQKTDMKATWADIEKAKKLLSWQPETSFEEGLKNTIEWFEENWDWVREVNI